MDISYICAFLHAKNKLDVIRYIVGRKKSIDLRIYGFRFRLGGVELPYVLSLLYYVYHGKRYRELAVKGKVVIDVGGYIGDSALYFASHGAKKVYSVEAFPQLADLIKENAKLNKLDIKVINAAISPKRYERIPKNVKVSTEFEHGVYKVRGIKIADLPQADLIKINLNPYSDKYIKKQIPLLKKRYAQIYWNEHLKSSNRVFIWKHQK